MEDDPCASEIGAVFLNNVSFFCCFAFHLLRVSFPFVNRRSVGSRTMANSCLCSRDCFLEGFFNHLTPKIIYGPTVV